MVDRAERSLAVEDIARIAGTFHAWRGTASAKQSGLTYEDEPGFCCSASLGEIKASDYALTPGRYIGAVDTADDDDAIEAKVNRLASALIAQFEEADRLAEAVKAQLARVK